LTCPPFRVGTFDTETEGQDGILESEEGT
jgi:hypothetical protein